MRVPSWATVARPDDPDDLSVAFDNEPIQMGQDEIQPWGSSPVAQKPLLNVTWTEWLPQQRIFLQINLTNREIIGSTPVTMKAR